MEPEETHHDVQLAPHLNFRDQTREAMAFYQEVFGGDLSMNTFEEFNAAEDPAEADQIMHSQLVAANGLVLVAADVPKRMDLPVDSSISLTLSGDDEPTLRGWYDALVEDGTVLEPLAQAPWGDYFGMCVDRSGVRWMVDIDGSPA